MSQGPLAGRSIRPMKAKPADMPASSEGWAYELKWDGMRIVSFIDDDGVRLQSANLKDATRSFPELGGLANMLAGLGPVVLDGEAVAIGGDGRPSFSLLQQRMHVHDANEALRRAVDVPISYAIFDLLHLDGHDTMSLAFRDRRRLLESVVDDGPHWRLTDLHLGDPDELLATVQERGLEGLVAKQMSSSYVEGKRVSSWRKIKPRYRQEFVVGGWAEGRQGLEGTVGSLLLGVMVDGGFRHCGSVGSGLTTSSRAEWCERLCANERKDSPFDSAVAATAGRRFRWSAPLFVVEVAFGEWTPDGHLRHPVYLGWRTDKDPKTVVREG
jgi:bifunctional non-homologous end joining protein LigD